jgi:hypothetical protein
MPGPERPVLIGNWRKLHKDEFNNFSSPSVIRMVKSRRFKYTGHAAQ